MTDTELAGFPLQELGRRIQAASRSLPFARPIGQVHSVSPSVIAVAGLSRWLSVGAMVEIASQRELELAEVIRLDKSIALCKPYRAAAAIGLGSAVHPIGELLFYPHDSWRGRIINAMAKPVDGKGGLQFGINGMGVSASPPEAMSRQFVSRGIATGVRVVDAFTPICLGQRIGIFAGSGVGKSTLLSMLAQGDAFDSVIIALVGERGREVREFVEVTLGETAAKAVTVVATGDESAMMRRLAPLLATTLAEYMRDQGQNVLLVMDSVTRYAHACREVALSAGEPPVARGYPPSIFSNLPRLLERAGPGARGSGTITGIYAVLVDGDDHNDPVADAVRGTLDGHIVLERAIAEQGRYPAVNVLSSLSRLSGRVWTTDQAKVAAELRKLIARFEETRDLRAMGGYVAGADIELDRALITVPKIYSVLNQSNADLRSTDAFKELAIELSRAS